MKKNKLEWDYQGNHYKVGESLDSLTEENTIYPIVWFDGRLYKAFIKPESRPKKDRVCLIDYYNPTTKKPYWTTVDRVFHIIKT